MSVQPTAAYWSLKRLWMALPDGPLAERDLEERIIEIAKLHPGDFGGASGRIAQLAVGGALRSQRGEDGQLRYVRSQSFPEYADAGPGSAAYNARIERQVQAERDRRDRVERQEAENRRKLDAPIIAAERAEFNRRVDARLRELGLISDEPALAGSHTTRP